MTGNNVKPVLAAALVDRTGAPSVLGLAGTMFAVASTMQTSEWQPRPICRCLASARSLSSSFYFNFHIFIGIFSFLLLLEPINKHLNAAEIKNEVICVPQSDICILDVSVNGVIMASDVDFFRDVVSKWNRGPILVALNSGGGSIESAIEIGRALRKTNAAASVARGAKCASACVLILVGAVSRQVSGQVGIHRFYFDVPKNIPDQQSLQSAFTEVSSRIKSYIREMNMPDSFFEAMSHIAPARMKWLTRAEIEKYNLAGDDPVYHEIFELQQAHSYGLNRQEYMRRSHRALVVCGQLPSSQLHECREAVMSGSRK